MYQAVQRPSSGVSDAHLDFVWMEPTNSCNLQCLHCPDRDRSFASRERLKLLKKPHQIQVVGRLVIHKAKQSYS
jgi:MoaA/NifB/PqqE/SkfB family radical SAM enzyme